MGKYQDEDMAGLDITRVRDYATFMALSATGQGRGGEAAIARFEKTVVGGGAEDRSSDVVWMEFCGDQSEKVGKVAKDSYELFDELFDERYNVTSVPVNGVMKKMMPSLGHGRIIRNRSSNKNISKDGKM